ncbi:MAG: hypothetical protein FWD52_02365 [Candidatus Bathyarchaeota archaeon]|nr:hypothetical protein [Candidatus Termiticorpusculum sp.]
MLNVIKIGGSLAQNPQTLQALCQKLNTLSNKHQIVIVPGGGKFADCVREADKQFTLSKTTSHHMAILAMNQYGLLLADLMKPNSQTTDNLKTAKTKTHTDLITIFLPSKLLTQNNTKNKKDNKEGELPNSWEVTSDTIAAYIAKKLDAKKLVLIKNVDGIFTDNPKKEKQPKLIEHLTTKELFEKKNNTCTDTHLPNILKTLKINCHIINGLYPNRIETTLNKQKTTGTIISP